MATADAILTGIRDEAIGAKENVGTDDDALQTNLTRIIQNSELARDMQGSGFAQGDTQTRGMLVREILNIIREDRRNRAVQQEEKDDLDYLSSLTQRGMVPVAKLISFTAEFASEIPHYLMSDVAKREIAEQYTTASTAWDYFCSDKLEAHVREVCEFIRVRNQRRLSKLRPEHIIHWDTEDSKVILTAFARCVATRWRTTSIASAKAYKTTKQIETIRGALLESLSFFSCAGLHNNRMVILATPGTHVVSGLINA